MKKELLQNGIIQQELLLTIRDLNKTIRSLTETLHLIENHEYLTMHRSKWKVALYNVTLGITFAIGTVLGLVLLSWFTYKFFEDSTILKNVIENQLKMRQFNISDIREKARQKAEGVFQEMPVESSSGGNSISSNQFRQ